MWWNGARKRRSRALIDARIPAKRIRRSLESLRRELPDSVPLSGLSISAVGEHVVVRDGDSRRRVDSGQYLLGLDVSLENGELHVVERREEAPISGAHRRPDSRQAHPPLAREPAPRAARLRAAVGPVDQRRG